MDNFDLVENWISKNKTICTIPFSETSRKRVVIDLHFGDALVLVGCDCHEGGEG